MFPWSFSWLPSLPSIDLSLPSGIQKRFISFALRQSLGHFLKPGQLDVQQVDSQIGSGYVQVRDLELNDEVINALISGLPIRLRDGSVGKVTARIPWPNPLTSSVGLSLESLHLTFYLEPSISPTTERPLADNLAESVASVAETFIHEELSEHEEATLRESFHPDLGTPGAHLSEDNVPGSLDPFITEEQVHQHDADPPGVSIFATLIERLLARFQFDAVDTRITIVNPQETSFTLIVPEIRYSTDSQAQASASPGGGSSSEMGEVRKVVITGVTVTSRCLRPLGQHSLPVPRTKVLASSPQANSPEASSPTSPTSPTTPVSAVSAMHAQEDEQFPAQPQPQIEAGTTSPPPDEPSSPHSDSSDMDEETQLFMSQSIAALPPRPVSPASSIASSMYQSAISASFHDKELDDIPEEAPRSRSPTPSPPSPPSQAPLSLPTPLPPSPSPSPSPTSPSPSCPMLPSQAASVLGSSSSAAAEASTSLPTVGVVPSPVTSPFQRRFGSGTHEIEDDTILSLGTEPIEIRLTTPSSRVAQSSANKQTSEQPDSAKRKKDAVGRDAIRIDLTIGLLACAFTARQIRGIIDITDVWLLHSPPPRPARPANPPEQEGSAFPLGDLESSLRIRGIVILLLPSMRTSASNPDDTLTEYFARPLVPPRLPAGYTRIHVDGISTSLSMRRGDMPKGKRMVQRREPSSVSASLTVSDVSVFAFFSRPDSGGELYASPVLITDPYLSAQYPPAHIHPSLDTVPDSAMSLPMFDMVDWTDSSQRNTTAKLSLWRTKPPASGRPTSQAAHPDTRQTSPIPTSPSRASYELSQPSTSPTGRPIPVLLPSSPGRLGLAGLSSSPQKNNQPFAKPASPALVVKFRSATSPPKDRRESSGAADVQVSLAPLHVFLDLGSTLGPNAERKSEALRFVGELTESRGARQIAEGREDMEDVESEQDSEEGGSRPGTPKVSGIQALRELEMERERRRLEQMVLEDLDLGYDYRKPEARHKPASSPTSRQTKKRTSQAPATNVTIRLPAVRVEVRVPPPALRSPRSGAVIIDLHDLLLSLGQAPPRGGAPSARFGTADDLYGPDSARPLNQEDSILLGATWKRIVVAHSLVGESKARAILSLGPLTIQDGNSFGVGTPPTGDLPSPGLSPQLIVRRTPAAPSPHVSVNTTTVSLDIPSVHVELTKPLLDGLQLWADDLTQCMDAAFSERPPSDTDTERAGSADSSMIGSRYFARTSTMSSAPDSGVTSLAATIKARETRSETAVKVTLTEVAVRLLVPRGEGEHVAVRPFDLTASDVDVLLELKPEGKDETVITVGVMDLSVHDSSSTGRNCFLSLTTPRSLTTTVKSAIKLRFTSLVVPETTAKESRVRLTLCGITYHFYPDLDWAASLGRFVKAPPGAFESVVPSERTRINVKILDTSIRLLAPSHPGALVPYIGELDFSTVIEGNSPVFSINLSIPSLALLLVDDVSSFSEESDTATRTHSAAHGVAFWKSAGYALIVELSDLILSFKKIDSVTPPDSRLLIDQGDLRLHMCADTMGALGSFIGDFSAAFKTPSSEAPPEEKRRNEPAQVTEENVQPQSLLSSLDDHAFRRLPEVGAAPDMIEDDLPTNPDYLDESFGAAAGLRELSDDVETSYSPSGLEDPRGVTSVFGGETIRMLRPEGLRIVENHFETLPPEQGESGLGDTTFRMRLHDFNITVLLYDGYDWVRTRKIIEEKAKEMRRKLAKIRQLVASGQTPDPSVEETNALLFNSVYIGLEHNVDELEPGALIAAIDEELNDDFETTTQSSWQSLQPQPLSSPGRGGSHSSKAHRRRLRRAKGPSIEFRLLGLDAEVDNYRPDASLVSRILATVRDVEILDHIKTSTWKKFLTSLQTDSRGNVRESDSNMVRVELRTLHPVPGHPSEEARLRAKILPLRLHVDQDALDFLKQFFSFKDPDAAPPTPSEPGNEIYFQQAEVFPIDIKLDYKPRRVDYRALKEGKTIELMNFFHFDGAEMTLRHITLNGITGWPRFFDLLNDLWTPDVKATQLVDVISGVAPIRSVVNVGSGVADLVLLPIAQYKKDGRVVRGLQKGANAFVKSTAMEAIKLGARLATGTQVILEQAETVLGGQFKEQVMAETMQFPGMMEDDEEGLDEESAELISKYADQPTNVKEGVKSAYKSLKRNLNSAAQTILAVPMEVYERSGNEGPVRAVVRAVPIAVLKPMIGASEAVSKTLLGLQNTLDPNIRYENEDKYKRR